MFQTCSINLLFQDVIKESVQQDILTCTIHSEVLKDKPLSHSYVANFMKSFMSKVIYQLVRCTGLWSGVCIDGSLLCQIIIYVS